MLLAIMWASQANTIPTAFWTVGFLFLKENRNYLQDLRKAILIGNNYRISQNNISDSILGCSDAGSIDGLLLSSEQSARLINLACDPTSLLSRCCMESLRLRSSSTDVRIAATDVILPCCTRHPKKSRNSNETPSLGRNRHESGLYTTSDEEDGDMSPTSSSFGLQKFTSEPHRDEFSEESSVLIKKGTMVMICPWVSHIDSRLYEDPRIFNPDRDGANFPNGKGMHAAAAGVGGIAGVAFGGGKFRCPGRAFAEMELGVTVGLILAGLEIEIIEKDEEEEKESEAACRAWPGDAEGLLPAPDVTKLVGIKVPKGPCWVKVRRRGSGPTEM